MGIIGGWRWPDSDARFDENGTFDESRGGNGAGAWALLNSKTREYRMVWQNRLIDALILSEDGNRNDGRNSVGSSYSVNRK